MVNKYTPVTCYSVFYIIVRLYIYRYFCRCLFDRSRGTKTFHKILRGTSSDGIQGVRRGSCEPVLGVS